MIFLEAYGIFVLLGTMGLMVWEESQQPRIDELKVGGQEQEVVALTDAALIA